ncbi:MAG: T9SS type A sorting domain-containing protein [Flavobacteriales bacterium]|nr:T9SS type A sorting domain-containing protein [Flavobacteriales bacterium]
MRCIRGRIARTKAGLRRLLLYVIVLVASGTARGQCTNTTAYMTVAAPTTNAPLSISTCTFQSEYNTVTGLVAGATYTVTSSCGGYITVRRGTYNGTLVANGNTPLSFTAPVAGTYYLHFNTNAACGTASTCCTTTIACASCAGPAPCAAVNLPSLPVTSQAVSCHSSDLINTLNVSSLCGSASTLYLGGVEALYTVTPATTGNYLINYIGQSYSSIWVFSGACPAAGGLCQGSVSGVGTSQSLTITMTAGTTYWILFDTWPSPPSPCPGTFSISTSNVPPPVVASDCNQAVNVCTNINFQIDPNGYGNVNEIPPLGSTGNPDYGLFSFVPPYYNPWGTTNEGCLRAGELNSTWMVVNVLTGGSLTFTFGGLGTQGGFYDWIMYPYNASACTQVAANALAPVRCNWNGVSFGGTGLASTPPAGGDVSNFEPPLNVGSNTQWLICFSNWSSVTTAVPLQFGGTAVVSCSPLPLELIAFEATAQGGRVLLEWTTASEVNSMHFEVERSIDMEEWEKVDVVGAVGTSNVRSGYTTMDHAPLPGLSYYRLRIVDLDGSFTFSPVRSVRMMETALVCHPNPTSGSFTVLHVPDGGVIEVLDVLGRSVQVDARPSTGGSMQVRLFLPSPGLYTVRMSNGADVAFTKVLISEQ